MTSHSFKQTSAHSVQSLNLIQTFRLNASVFGKGDSRSSKCASPCVLVLCVCVCVVACVCAREAAPPPTVIMRLKAPPPSILNPLYPLMPWQTFTHTNRQQWANIWNFCARDAVDCSLADVRGERDTVRSDRAPVKGQKVVSVSHLASCYNPVWWTPLLILMFALSMD